MTTAHLWAIGYDDMQRADQVREEIVKLGWDKHYLCLLDVAVVVRHQGGSFSFDRKPFPAAGNVLGCTMVGLLAGLVVGAPLTKHACRRPAGQRRQRASGSRAQVGIGVDFIHEVTALDDR